MPMLTTDTVMAVDMVATDMADTDMAAMVATTEERGPLMPKPLPPLKLMPMLTTDTAVDTDMVATTEERGPLTPKPLPLLMLMPMLTTDMVDTTAVDTDTVMAMDMEATDTAVDTTGVEYFILIQISLYRILDLRVENSTNSLH